jgi:hypothetical protein
MIILHNPHDAQSRQFVDANGHLAERVLDFYDADDLTEWQAMGGTMGLRAFPSVLLRHDAYERIDDETGDPIPVPPGWDIADTPTAIPPLPTTAGEWVEVQLYTYGDVFLFCRQRHQRTVFEPHWTPALFSVWQPEQDGLAWIANEAVEAGWLRIYNGRTYECIQKHTTQADWQPPNVPALWSLVPDGDEWQSGFLYQVGAEVARNGIRYLSRRGNNSWTPGTNDSGWLQITPVPAEWYFVGNEGYPLGWLVWHEGQQWRNDSPNNFWQPGVFGWVLHE